MYTSMLANEMSRQNISRQYFIAVLRPDVGSWRSCNVKFAEET